MTMSYLRILYIYVLRHFVNLVVQHSAAKMDEYLIILHSTYEPHPQWKYCTTALEHGNAVKIHNGIMLDFYQGLPHTIILVLA